MRHLWIIGLLASGAAWAQEAPDGVAPLPDPGRGLDIALETCAACHAVRAGEGQAMEPQRLPFPLGVPLPFEDIANTSGVTEPALLAWLFTTHPTMPDIIVSPQEARDLVAYILSLGEQEI